MSWVHNLHGNDPNSQIPRVIAISLVFSISSFLAVCLRFYVRLRTKRLPWYDDYAALVASILTLAYASIMVAQTRWGQGLSSAYFPLQNVIPFSKIQYAGGPVYVLDLLFFKVALLASYLRIGGFVTSYRNIIIGVIAVVSVTQIILTFFMSFSCAPVAKIWDTSLDGSCIDSVKFYYGLAGINIGFDLAIIALPLPVLWNLQLRVRQKIVLSCMFCLGFFVTAIQIIRIFSVKNLKTYTDSKDLILWSIIEVSLGVIVSCIPHYGPLFKAFASTITSYRNRESDPNYPLDSTRPKDSKKRGSRGIKSSSQTILGAKDHNNSTIIGTGEDNWSGSSTSEENVGRPSGGFEIRTTTDFTVERN